MADILNSNFFELFGLPVSFDVDLGMVRRAYMDLQKQVHPDNFASGSDQQKRLAMQQTSHLNEAHETLKDVVLRASYMLHLKGVDINLGNETTKDMTFLMEQMQTREKLEHIRTEPEPLEALDALAVQVARTTSGLCDAFIEAYEDEDVEQARECVRKLQFMKKAKTEIDSVTADIEDEMMS